MPSFNQLLVEGVMPCVAMVPKDYTGAAGTTAVWFNMKNFNACSVIIQTGAWAGGTAAVTLSQAVSSSGGSSKALAFGVPYYWIGTSASGTLVRTAISSDTFNLSAANKIIILEVPAKSLDLANNFNYFQLAIASPGVNADLYSACYIGRQPRFAQGGSGTSMSDPFV